MESGLKGKKCLITGGNTGIGLGMAASLAAEGVELAIAGLQETPEVLAQLRGMSGGQAIFKKVDVGDERQVAEMVEWAIASLGGLDLFVNNAAIALHEPVTQITSEKLFKTFSVNLAACVWAGREVAKHMIARGAGSILITGSTVRFCPAYTETSYRISKMGLKMYMETLAIELAPYGIRVNMLTPGHHRTALTAGVSPAVEKIMRGQIPLRRLGTPDECGPAAVFLLSDRLSSYITGTEIVIDGGLALRPLPIRSDEEILKLNQQS